MKNRTLLKINILISVVILIGFFITSIISYQSNMGIFEKDVEMVSTLALDGLYNEISAIFSQPVSVSLTMANDSLLKDFLSNEDENRMKEEWLMKMREYLNGYRLKYGYDSVFLVSATTNNYYHYEGLDRILTKDNEENKWYYSFLEGKEEYALNVDNDEATDNSITVFINCKIKGQDQSVIGIVGVGLRVNSLQSLLDGYEKEYGIRAYLIDNSGMIEISSLDTGHENKNLFDSDDYAESKSIILENRDTQEKFWQSNKAGECFMVSSYEPNLKWHLLVENDIGAACKQLNIQLAKNIVIIICIAMLVLVIITTVFKRYNVQITELTVSQELEYRRLLQEATEGLYDNIYELDITHNQAASDNTKRYFESMGLNPEATYDEALQIVTSKHVKKEYIQGYLDTFSPQAVIQAYKSGISNLVYDLMLSEDGENYRWFRISAQIFYWNSDKSIRMITYRKDIDTEKKRELLLLESVLRDSMTGLYNKKTMEDFATYALKQDEPERERFYVFLIFDIDNFKSVNDNMGHSYGDYVIHEMAGELKTQFREDDILGRVGGDEFAVLMKHVDSLESLKRKLSRLCSKIEKKNFGEKQGNLISCSIGVALFPMDGTTYAELYEKADQALYHAKSHGKNSYVLYHDCIDDDSFHTSQRSLELLIDNATDGLAQYACTKPLKLLYFNQKCVELFGVPASVLSSADYNPMSQLHPDDVEEIEAAVETAAITKETFVRVFRVRHENGNYFNVKLQGVFVGELYKNQYPIFYVMYTKQ